MSLIFQMKVEILTYSPDSSSWGFKEHTKDFETHDEVVGTGNTLLHFPCKPSPLCALCCMQWGFPTADCARSLP